MIKNLYFLILGCVLLFSVEIVNGQDRFKQMEDRLNLIAAESPGLNEKIELSISGSSIQEFVRGLAVTNNLNISVDPNISVMVSNTFSNVAVKDVLLFLCKKYNLDIVFVGNILSISNYIAQPVTQTAPPPKNLKISYDSVSKLLSIDVKNDSLYLVTKELTRITGVNFVFAPELTNNSISVFIQNSPITNAMEKMAFANNLKITYTSDNFFLIEKKDAPESSITQQDKNKKNGKKSGPKEGLEISVVDELVSVNASNIPIIDIISGVCEQLAINFFIFSEPKGNTSLKIYDYTFDEFLRYLLNGTEYTFKKDSNIYLIGDRNLEGLRSTKLVQFKYRSAEKILDYIPADLKKGVDIKIFPDLNSLILSGSDPRITEIEEFIRKIDKVVPVVVIDVLIVDVRDSRTLTTGIKAALSEEAKATTGSIFPELDMTLSSSSINSIIDGINGFGSANLGKVTPNFFVTIQAFEKQGLLRIRSTPKLATINGHEAKLTIGETRYYLEIQNNIIGTQNPQTQITQSYKPINADLSVIINPMVSGDEQITLDIKVKQSSFGERISNNAPYGTINRDFQSLIRVKNEEMILLGGLDENSFNDSGSGVPLLSRIPVVKWLFSSRSKTNSKNKLTIFIKPTVIY